MKKFKILIVDDEPDIVTTVHDQLEADGFETVAASEGVRAIEMAHRQKPDLILLDLKMPAGTGQAVLRALRSRPDTEKIPIIVLTALQGPQLEKEVRK